MRWGRAKRRLHVSRHFRSFGWGIIGQYPQFFKGTPFDPDSLPILLFQALAETIGVDHPHLVHTVGDFLMFVVRFQLESDEAFIKVDNASHASDSLTDGSGSEVFDVDLDAYGAFVSLQQGEHRLS